MGLITLKDTKFYQALKQRDTSNSKMYAGILLPIESDLSDVLQYIKREFPDFPDHGMQHSLRILDYISTILTEEELENISDTELFCLIISSFFHDTGMAYAKKENKNVVRQNHHEYAEPVIEDYFNNKLNLLNKKDRIKSVVIFSCKAHGMELYDLYKDTNFEKIDTIDFDEVRYSLIAILLRIGDLMDLENDRTNPFILSSFYEIYTKDAYDHNVRHIQINFYHHSPEQISAEVEAQNPNQYKIWSKWFQYLNDEILHANTYLKKFNFFFPQPNMKIKKEDGADFDVEELRFEIDENGGIWNIISKSIYTDEFDFLRELIQNAIDATLVNIYNDLSIEELNISPRSWNSDRYCKNIIVAYSEESNKLYVIDFGIGMDVNDLHRFLFKVSSSGYTDAAKRDFTYPSLSKYGIGFVSCLINADKIEIYTRKHNDKFMHYVSMESNVNLAFIQNIMPDDYIGTSIVLTLKHKFSYTKIENYITATFRYPSVKIDCVNIDSLREVSEKININQKFDTIAINEKPYKIGDIYSKILKQHSSKIDKINMKKNIYDAIHNELSSIIDWIDDNVSYDEKYSDTKKFNNFKKMLNNLTRMINQYDFVRELPLSIDKINIKDMFNTDVYINSLKSYEEYISSEENSLQKNLQYYHLLHHRIHNKTVSMEFNWKYCVVFFDDTFNISDIRFSKIPPDLSTGSGVIFIYHTNYDYNKGIEYSAINGFLFAGGEICNDIAHLTRYEEQPYGQRNESDIIIGIHNEYNMEAELENHFFESLYDYENNDDFYSYRTDDGSYELGIAYKEIYDTATIKDNDFLFVFNKERNNYSALYNPDDLLINSSSLSELILNANNSIDIPDADEILKVLSIVTDNIYQDGIMIPFSVTDLIPIGYFRIDCNLTAKSRMALNVTRLKPSENKDDMANWMHIAGSDMQKTILHLLNEEFKKLHLYVDFKSLYTRDLRFDCFSDSYNKILSDLK